LGELCRLFTGSLGLVRRRTGRQVPFGAYDRCKPRKQRAKRKKRRFFTGKEKLVRVSLPAFLATIPADAILADGTSDELEDTQLLHKPTDLMIPAFLTSLG